MTGPDPDDNQVDFFISYTGSDEAWATWVAHQLETAGYRVLIQAWDFVSYKQVLPPRMGCLHEGEP